MLIVPARATDDARRKTVNRIGIRFMGSSLRAAVGDQSVSADQLRIVSRGPGAALDETSISRLWLRGRPTGALGEMSCGVVESTLPSSLTRTVGVSLARLTQTRAGPRTPVSLRSRRTTVRRIVQVRLRVGEPSELPETFPRSSIASGVASEPSIPVEP
jgi:hypothetical protein